MHVGNNPCGCLNFLLAERLFVRGSVDIDTASISVVASLLPQLVEVPHTHQPKTEDNTNAAMTIPDEVDIIVVGGGSCGCVVAGRLANLDHSLQVMLVEAGESNLNVRLSSQAAIEGVV